MSWNPPAMELGQSLDVVGVGEAMLLLQAPPPESISVAQSLEVRVAGAELNACAAVTRLGGVTAFLTRVGDDPAGKRVRSEIRHLGVRDDLCAVDAGHPTGLFLRETPADGTRRVSYYRSGSAAANMSAQDAERYLQLPTPRALILSGLTAALGDGPRYLLVQLAQQASRRGTAIVVDANLRPGLGNMEEAINTVKEILPLTNLLVLGDDESDALFGAVVPAEVIAAAAGLGVAETVLKGGEHGCWFLGEGGGLVHQPAVAETVIDTVGAGDAFLGGYLAARLSGLSQSPAARLGSRIAGSVIATAGDTEGLPSRQDALALLRSAHINPLDAV